MPKSPERQHSLITPRDAAATFESDLPALQTWRCDAEDAQRVDVPVLLVSGTASGPLFEEIRDLVHAWLFVSRAGRAPALPART